MNVLSRNDYIKKETIKKFCVAWLKANDETLALEALQNGGRIRGFYLDLEFNNLTITVDCDPEYSDSSVIEIDHKYPRVNTNSPIQQEEL